MTNVTLYTGSAMKIMRVLFSLKRRPLRTVVMPKNVPNAVSITDSRSKIEKKQPILPMSYYIE